MNSSYDGLYLARRTRGSKISFQNKRVFYRRAEGPLITGNGRPYANSYHISGRYDFIPSTYSFPHVTVIMELYLIQNITETCYYNLVQQNLAVLLFIQSCDIECQGQSVCIFINCLTRLVLWNSKEGVIDELVHL